MTNRLIFVLSNAGLLVSLYLLWTYVTSASIVCTGQSCDVVRASAYSHLLGVPLPLFGVAFYTLLIGLSFTASMRRVFKGFELNKAILLISAFGFVYSIYLTYLEAFVIKAFCDWCVASGIIITLIFTISLKENFYEKIVKQ